jgi:hypothetical protein
MAAKKKITLPEEPLKLYNQLIALHPEIERKGATMPYTSVNGHMFSFLDKTGTMSLRLSKDDRAHFITKYNTKLSEQHGRIMKDYVLVPETLLKQTETLLEHLKISYDYVKSLKPKPTKKKKIK